MAITSAKKQQQVELAGMEALSKAEGRFEKTADKLIQVEINKRKNSYQWTNDGEAFAHLFVQYRFDLDEEEAAQCSEVGRAGHDKGIDAYYQDEATETFYIVQTKSNRIPHDEQILHEDVRKAIDFLHNDSVKGVKDTLREALEIFRETRQKRYDIVFVLGLNGSTTKVREAIPDFELQLPFKCQIEVFDVDDIRALVMRTQVIPESGPTVSFTLPAKPWELDLGDQSPKMISCVVQAKELGKYIRKHRLEIFRLNVREYLGPKNPVNRVVAESLRENPSKFCYLNLGIDAVCEKTEIEEPLKDLLGQETWILTVRNFQIINGCQTAKTISEVDPDSRAYVVIRLIELGKEDKERREELVPQISVAKNRQSAIHGRDLFAWDRDQVRLKKEFQELGIFFETREKEWNALTKMKKASIKKVFPKGQLENTLTAKAYLSVFLQDPFRAKHKKREFFQHEKEGGAFERIFSDTPAEQMLLAANIYQYVDEKRKEAGRKYRKLEKEAHKRTLSDEENFELEEANVVRNGDTYLASIIGLFFVRYYGQDLLSDKEELILTRHLLKQIPTSRTKKVLEPLYDFARETIVQTYQLLQSQQPTPELFTPRRFFYLEKTYELLKRQVYAKSLHSLSTVLKPLKK